MNKGIGLFAGLTALLAMGSAEAACPIPNSTDPKNAGTNEATGHIFEVYEAANITWPEARDCAISRNSGGVIGHLATITSSAEDKYVNDLKNDIDPPSTSPGPLALAGEVWVGGSQTPSALNAWTGWNWENSEGPISVPGLTPGPDYYANWAAAPPAPTGKPEPNDYYGAGTEDYLAIGLYSSGTGWNDEGALGNIKGFIVEYDIPRTAQCSGNTGPAGTDCNTIDGQTLVFPQGSFEGGKTIEFTAYEFTDPRVAAGTCGIAALPPLFTDPVFNAPDDSNPLTDESRPLKIPPYLCGSPDFVVVKVNSEDLSILKGAVLVENETDTVLPDNLYKCVDPIFNNPAANPDPQYQDVVVWQSTDPTRMLENQSGTGDFQGAATEATNGCNSTVAKVRGASYFVVGMHIDFGSAYNYNDFVDLTRYKLTLLKKSIAAARSIGSLRPAVSTAMEALIALAIYRLDQGNPAGALIQVRQFLWLVNAATYTPKPNVNYNGDHLMRGENIAFTLRVKVIPYKPVL